MGRTRLPDRRNSHHQRRLPFTHVADAVSYGEIRERLDGSVSHRHTDVKDGELDGKLEDLLGSGKGR